jgi:cell division protein FtsL
VIAAAVIGLITLQLVHLQLAHGAGTAIERQEALQRQDASLNVEDSVLSSAPHIQSVAQSLGMAMVAEGALHILNARGPLDARRAAESISEPSAAAQSEPSTATSGAATGESTTTTGGAASTEAQGTTTQAQATPTSETSGGAAPTSGAATQAPAAGSEQGTETTQGTSAGGTSVPAG